MANLSEVDRRRIWRGLMRYWSRGGKELGDIVKEDIYDAVASTDAFIDGIQATFNQALPEPYRTEADLDEKTLLFCAVAAMRVSVEFARTLFGGLD